MLSVCGGVCDCLFLVVFVASVGSLPVFYFFFILFYFFADEHAVCLPESGAGRLPLPTDVYFTSVKNNRESGAACKKTKQSVIKTMSST